MQVDTRLLTAADATELERFLVAHRDSSMFLRTNAARGGLEYRGQAEQATYVAEVADGAIVGVAAHSWTGMLLVQAPDGVEELARRCVHISGRKITGLSGPLEQVKRARAALGLSDAPAFAEEDEGLYALALRDLRVPAALSGGSLEARAPSPAEVTVLYEWRFAYDIEALGSEPSEATRARSAAFLDAQLARGDVWVALSDGRLASLSAFNASLPDIVQLGGIYTPPELRSRGYGKAAVAASLVAARARGASRAVLFANQPSAIRCYTALGFRRIGDYGLVLFQ